MDNVGSMKWFVFGVLSIMFAILSTIWTPLHLALEERLQMRQGFFPFEWWFNTPDVVRLKMTLFNITNSDAFLNGTDKKLKLQEVGPIVFREIWNHSNPIYNENGTLTYTLHKHLIYDPSLNTIDLNATMICPNVPILLSASLFWDANIFVKMSLNYIYKHLKSKTIVKKTIYEILFNYTDPFLNLGNTYLPSVAFTKNVGLLTMMYSGGADRINMYIGSKHGHQKFSLIYSINGSTSVPGQRPSCKDSVIDTTELSLYNQLVPKTNVIHYLRLFVCRAVPITYSEETYRQGVKVYLFKVPKDAFNRTKPPENDCYKGTPSLPNGLYDMSPCWNSYPVVGSFPHFLYGDPQLQHYVDGLMPDVNRHLPYVTVDPITGLAFESKAMMQTNMNIRPLDGFDEIFDKFSNTVIPMFYGVIGHDHLPDYVVNSVKFMTLLPTISNILTMILTFFGIYCMWNFYNKNRRKGRIFSSNRNNEAIGISSAEAEKDAHILNLKDYS